MKAFIFRIHKDGKTMYPVAIMATCYNDAISQIEKTGATNFDLIHITSPSPRSTGMLYQILS